MIVGATTQRMPSASTAGGRCGVGFVDDEGRRRCPRRAGRRRRRDASWPSSRSMRSAGPLSAAPATIGETATTCVAARRAPPRARRARRAPGRSRRAGSTARSPPWSASAIAVEHARCRACAPSAPSKRSDVTGDRVLPADEVLLERRSRPRPPRSPSSAARSSVAGTHAQVRGPSAAAISAVTVDSGAPSAEPTGAVEVGAEVAVAEPEPRRPAVAARPSPSPATSRRAAPSPSRD